MRLKDLKEITTLNKKPLLIVLVLLLAVLGLYVYISQFQSNELSAMRESWSEKRRLAAIGAAGSQASVYFSGQRDLKVFYDRVPAKKEFARIVGELFETAANNGLVMGSVGYKPGQGPEKHLMYYQLALNLSGNYAAVKSFLADIRRMPEILTIDAVSLSGGEPMEEKVELKIHITAYFNTEQS
jgi:Tfp pilus assembly protein PilO